MVSGRMPGREQPRKIAELRASGLSIVEIARKLGLPAGAIQQALANERRPRRDLGRCCACNKVLKSPVALAREKDIHCLACLAQLAEPTFAQKLKAFRVAAGWTQKELALRAGVARDRISVFEHGHQEPRWTVMARLFRALGVRWVMNGTDRHREGA